MGVGGQLHALAALPHGRDPIPILQEAGWAPGPIWTGADNLALTGIRSPDHPAAIPTKLSRPKYTFIVGHMYTQFRLALAVQERN